MARQAPTFSIGIEEEYLLVDRDSLALREAPDEMMEACRAELEGQVSPEYLSMPDRNRPRHPRLRQCDRGAR